jgi:excisionase family DNA binding protein
MDDEHLTLPELARWLRVSLRHVQRLLETGDGPPSIRIGRRVIFNRVAVQRWLEARTTAKTPAVCEPHPETARQSGRRLQSPKNGGGAVTCVTGGGDHERS